MSLGDIDTGSSCSEDESRELYIPDDFGKLDMRIGRITDVQLNPYAKRKKPCYIAHVDVGEDISRAVGSELNLFYKKEDLLNRLVVILCNVHAKKKGNMVSEAWIISACNEEKKIELLDPPQDCEEGEQVTVEGFPLLSDIRDEKIPRTTVSKKILQEVRVNDERIAVFRRIPLRVEGHGVITTQTLADCMVTDSFLNFKYEPYLHF